MFTPTKIRDGAIGGRALPISSLRSLLFFMARAFAIDPAADATAKFLAGMPLDETPLANYANNPVWTAHAAEFDRAWTQLEQRQLVKIRAWAPAFVGDVYQDNGPLFYMFSGPDFLYANAFFPNANTYILCGTEPIGPVPNIQSIPPEILPGALANLRKSLDSLLNWSFFITKNMKLDLTQTQLNGTLPLLYIFIARAGYTIDSVATVGLDRNGNFITSGKASAAGVKIVFSSQDRPPQTLYYFTTDLGNDGIRSNPGFMKFCQQQGVGVSFLKAASYLMHEESFSTSGIFFSRTAKSFCRTIPEFRADFSTIRSGAFVIAVSTSARLKFSKNISNPIS